MQPLDRSLAADTNVFSIAELEARFEMEALPMGAVGVDPALDWRCTCAFEF